MSIVLGIYDPFGSGEHQASIAHALAATASRLAPGKRFVTQQQEMLAGRLWLGCSTPVEMPAPDLFFHRHPFFFTGELFDGANLKDHLPADPDAFVREVTSPFPDGFLAKLNGRFLAVWWDEAAQALGLANDALGRLEVFLYGPDSEGRFAFSTSLLALALCGLFVPLPDAMEIQHLLATGFCSLNRTHVRQVEVLPPGVALGVLPDGRAGSRPYWRLVCDPQPMDESRWDQLVDSFLQALKRRIDDDCPVHLALSGGLDSRLLLAGLIRLGKKPGCVSFGAKACADREITDLLARMLRLRYEFLELAPDPDSFDARCEQIAVGWSGMGPGRSVFYPADLVDWNGRRVLFDGFGMEFAKGLYYPSLPADAVEGWDHDIVAHHLFRRMFIPRSRAFVAQGFDDYMLAQTLAQVRGASELTSSNLGILDLCYLDQDRRWGSAGSTHLPPARRPVHDLEFLQLVSQVPYAERRQRNVVRRMVRRLHPLLLTVPTVQVAWPTAPANLWERGARFLVYRVRGRYRHSEGELVPAGEFVRALWPNVERAVLSHQAVWHGWIDERRMNDTLRLHRSRAVDFGHHLLRLIQVETWWRVFREERLRVERQAAPAASEPASVPA